MNQDILFRLEQNKISLMCLITEGLSGKIYECSYLHNRYRYILKIQSIDEITSMDCVRKEIYNQIIASNLGVSPKVVLYGVYNDISWIMMERIHGYTLEHYMYERYASVDGWIEEPLYDTIRCSAICIKIRCKINTLQHHGLFHLDLHSSNILVDDDEQVYIIDFGNSIIEKDPTKQQDYKLCDELYLSEFITKSL